MVRGNNSRRASTFRIEGKETVELHHHTFTKSCNEASDVRRR
jgi:hypothetical protein